MSFKIVCLRPKEDFLKVGVIPPEGLSIVYLAPDDSNLAEQMAEARALVIPAVGPKLPAELFVGSQIELIQVTGAGIDRLDAEAMKSMNIAIANVAGGSSAALAEYAVSNTIGLLRRTLWADAELCKGNYVQARKRMVSEYLSGLEGLTVGLIGLGVIGISVAKAFHAMGAKIVYHDPAPRDAGLLNELDALSLPMDELLRHSDVVTLHVPLLPSTESMIDDQALKQMKPGAILINAARGGIVDEAALTASLSSGHLGGAIVDVFSTEPPQPDNPLFSLQGEARRRLILTPHIAGVTRQSWAFLFRSAWENVARTIIKGEAVSNRIV